MRKFSIVSIAAAIALVAAAAHVGADQGPSVGAYTAGDAGPGGMGAKNSLSRSGAGSATAPTGTIELTFDDGGKQVSAVQFLISAEADLSGADLSDCAGALPETHVGGCKIKGKNILFYAFSPVNAALPSGVLGHIGLGPVGVAGRVEVSEPVMADVNGVEMNLN